MPGGGSSFDCPVEVPASSVQAHTFDLLMAKEIIINATSDETQIAIVDQGQLAELHIENPDNARTLGDIYLGRVQSIRPNLEAAFVDIGEEQQGFLHFSCLAENLDQLLAFVKGGTPKVETFYETWKPTSVSEDKEARGAGKRKRKYGSPAWLHHKQHILVTVIKEPYGTKSPRLSTSISLAGRFLVLVPLADYTAVSKRIFSYKERRRLRALVKMLRPPGFGIIVRTVAEGKDARAIDTDLKLLLGRWRKIEAKLAEHPEPPVKIYGDVSLASSIIRDLFSDDYNRILVNAPRMFRNIRGYIQAVAPHMVKAVQLHSGKVSVFEAAGVSDQINEVFDTRVSLPSGGSLVIEQTEAMHVIDVNSGNTGRRMKAEDSALKVNLEAVKQIARQLRLRDLAGLIVVDFIDLRDERNRQKVVDALRTQLRADRVITDVLPMSDFGVVQITRQRKRRSITSTHFLTGRHQATEAPPPSPKALTSRIQKWLENHGGGGVHLYVHPFTAAWLTSGLASLQRKWQWRFKIKIKVVEDSTLSPADFRCMDAVSGHDVTDLSPRLARVRPPSRSVAARKTVPGKKPVRKGKPNNQPKSTRKTAQDTKPKPAPKRHPRTGVRPKRTVSKKS